MYFLFHYKQLIVVNYFNSLINTLSITLILLFQSVCSLLRLAGTKVVPFCLFASVLKEKKEKKEKTI
jgi:antibiotic biosynthesis monooxygenase (ABM) superfamily enzyme